MFSTSNANSNFGTIVSKSLGTSKTSNKSSDKKKKRLQYNFKEVSSRILKARTSNGASKALLLARQKLSQLLRQRESGNYNDSEIARAVLHAEAMVRVAKKKKSHLITEEEAQQQKKVQEDENIDEALDKKNSDDIIDISAMSAKDVQELMEELEEELKEAEKNVQFNEELEEMTEALDKNMDAKDLDNLKKQHRSKELRDILKVDMQYMKSLVGQLEREKASISSAISINIGNTEMPVPSSSFLISEVAGAAVDVQA